MVRRVRRVSISSGLLMCGGVVRSFFVIALLWLDACFVLYVCCSGLCGGSVGSLLCSGPLLKDSGGF